MCVCVCVCVCLLTHDDCCIFNFSEVNLVSKEFRHFYIMIAHCGCECDLGYLAVLDSTHHFGVCNWEHFDSSIMPMFLYSPSTSSTLADSKYGGHIAKCM